MGGFSCCQYFKYVLCVFSMLDDSQVLGIKTTKNERVWLGKEKSCSLITSKLQSNTPILGEWLAKYNKLWNNNSTIHERYSLKTANRGRETWIYQSCSLEHSSLWNNHSSLKGLLTKHHTLGNNTRCSLKPANCERMDLFSAVSSDKIPVITDPMDILSAVSHGRIQCLY